MRVIDKNEKKSNCNADNINCANTDFIGKSEPFKNLRETIETIGAYKSPVAIIGQTGTGKEIAARRIHLNSERKANKFFPVNCGAIAGHLFESQLFGHVKGAFTGADSNMLGYFRAADGGTLFLDEVAELNMEQQAKLLRVLEEKHVRPVGSTELYPVNVRIICATNRNLKELVQEGSFRADLYFRLNVVQLNIPPLRERKKDILLLANHFLQKQAQLYGEPVKKLSSHTKRLLISYRWPGNVRELANAIEHAHVTTTEPLIDMDVLPPRFLQMMIFSPALPVRQKHLMT